MTWWQTFISSLREINTISMCVRLLLAVLFGGIIGLEREFKRRPAGFRTYLLVCLGAAVTMLLGQYEAAALSTLWTNGNGVRTDVARIGAQVINGIGFLGAGTILVTGHQKVQGLTTAAGLWSSACLGLAVGAGFYECALFGFAFILLSIKVLPRVESFLLFYARNMNLYVEFDELRHIGVIVGHLRAEGVLIYDVELYSGEEEPISHRACAAIYVQLPPRRRHEQVIMSLTELDFVARIEEI